MSKSPDLWQTEYGVQPFTVDKRKLVGREVRPVTSGAAALRLGERLAPGSAGVLVFSQRSAPDLGEYETPKVLATHGCLPEELLEQLAA